MRGERRTTGIELGHGDPLPGRGPLLLVEVAPQEPLATAGWRQRLTDRLTATAAAGSSPDVPPGPVAARGVPAGTSWRRVEIPVDGVPVVFDLLAEGQVWVARAERGGLVLTLTARDLSPSQVALTRVSDRDRYLPGAG